nr:MAG TPA: hypothetical protein [Caudoviricetes sp.]
MVFPATSPVFGASVFATRFQFSFPPFPICSRFFPFMSLSSSGLYHPASPGRPSAGIARPPHLALPHR